MLDPREMANADSSDVATRLSSRRTVNTHEAPQDREPGDASALSDAEIDDVIAFLKTLSDRPHANP